MDLSEEKRQDLCKIMLEEVLQTVSVSNGINEIVVVSKDENALKIAKNFKATQLADNETGVNDAVKLADAYLVNNGFDASIVFPQDIPFIKPQDIDFLLRFQNAPKFVVVVPSRHFDGTNALVRMPVNLMETHYDEDSYKIHLTIGKSHTSKTSLAFVRRIMLDVDNNEDLRYLLQQNEKPDISEKILNLIKFVKS